MFWRADDADELHSHSTHKRLHSGKLQARATERTWVAAQLWRFPECARFQLKSVISAQLCACCAAGFSATNRPYVRLWSHVAGQGDGRADAFQPPARQRRIDHAGSNCSVDEFGDLRANSRCILGPRPVPGKKALSGARQRLKFVCLWMWSEPRSRTRASWRVLSPRSP